ncbi:MAG: hypothetical protein PWQ63_1674 [Methanolobus sp.]|jgi:hypothetical protein|nr:hypothetical protein [Methanolobus sp.]
MDMIIITLEVIIMILMTALLLIVAKFAPFLPLLFAKEGVIEIGESGQAVPRKARSVASTMITKKSDRPYRYTKKDVIRLCGITFIIANKDTDARAINPDVMPVISILKKGNVDSMEDVEAILKAPLYSKEKYEELLKAQKAQQAGAQKQ